MFKKKASKFSKAKGKKKFEYKPMTKSTVDSRKNQSGGNRAAVVKSDIKWFQPQSGDNTIRILPAGWDDANYYGFEVYQHYNIGPDRNTYLCARAMKDKKCPICDERERAEKKGDDKYADALKTGKRVAVYVIDRSKEGDGPKLWFMPWTLEKEIAALAIDKKTGEILQFPDPEEGYDVSFTKEGKELKTKYLGVQFDRKSSPLSDDEDTMDEWLAYIKENAIPDVLIFHDPASIKKQFVGGSASDDDDDDEPPRRSKLGGKRRDEEDDEEDDDTSLPTFEELWEMKRSALLDLVEEHDLELEEDPADMSLRELRAAIAEELGIEDEEDEDEEDEDEEEEDEEEDEEDEEEEEEEDEEEEEKPRRRTAKRRR